MSGMELYHEKERGKKFNPIYKNVKQAHTMIPKEVLVKNMKSIDQELLWLNKIIAVRIMNAPKSDKYAQEAFEIEKVPEFCEGIYHEFVKDYELTYVERLVLILAFTAEFSPMLLNKFIGAYMHANGSCEVFGGIQGQYNYQFIPTLHTALFLLSGEDLVLRGYYKGLLSEENILFREKIVKLEYPDEMHNFKYDPMLILDQLYSDYFLTGRELRFDYSDDFPAQIVETDMTPDDLVLDEAAQQKRDIIMHYLKANMILFSMPDVRKKVAPGFVVLLSGPPGTGKTLTATLMGKELNIPVYKVSLNRVVSKYIGETEKNLEKIFSRLEGRNVILFFDEADALFGKRTEINDSKDRYANQEISYLLQRIERWNGLVILSTNYEQNMDDAFARRISLFMHIDLPDADGREMLWRKGMPEEFQYESEVLIDKLVQIDGLSGALIALIIKRACIEAVNMDTKIISKEILTSIVNEVGFKHDVIVKKIVL